MAMTREDTLKLLTLLEAEYPQSFRTLDDSQRRLKMELWRKEFEDDDTNIVFAAARTLMRSGREFAPTSGQIREKMTEFANINALDEQQAWALVAKACTNGFYGYRTEFEKLPPTVQRAVGRAEQLKEWAVIDIDTLNTVVASNFMRSYRTALAREKELSRIPEAIRAQLTGIGVSAQLEGQNVRLLNE